MFMEDSTEGGPMELEKIRNIVQVWINLPANARSEFNVDQPFCLLTVRLVFYCSITASTHFELCIDSGERRDIKLSLTKLSTLLSGLVE
jgi:hypothetical protein